MDEWCLSNLVCPIDKSSLRRVDDALVSEGGRTYPIVDGVPVMLVEEDEQTIGVARASLSRAKDPSTADARAPHLYLESLGISDHEKNGILDLVAKEKLLIDPVVSFMVGATSGFAYKNVIGQLQEYPIPELRMSGTGKLLDIGCNWGRWSIAAAQKGFDVVGIDPSLGAIMAARRVARQLKLPIHFVVGDARRLPFPENSFNNVFSYSVLQHLSKPNAHRSISEVGRVLTQAGTSLIQMPNRLGVRSLYHQARRGFRRPTAFDVRYWSIPELRQTFEEKIGPSKITVDCYFGLGLQKSDAHLMPPLARTATATSEVLRSLSRRLKVLSRVADSVYIESNAL